MPDHLPLLQLAREDFMSQDTPLRKPCAEVIEFGPAIQEDIDALESTFESETIAVGLAAPQVGIRRRLCVVNIQKGKPHPHLILLNPKIVSASKETDSKFESCMSLPHFKGMVERPKAVEITYQERDGSTKHLAATGFLARVIQHEVDHLDGVLYVDRMVSLDGLEPVDFFKTK